MITFPPIAWLLHPLYKHTTYNPSIRSDEGLTLETSASLYLHGENLTFINLFDTKFSSFSSPTDAEPQFLQKLTFHLFDTLLHVRKVNFSFIR